jgi:type I restriction enzyme S subunit
MTPLSQLCLLAVDCVNKTAPVVDEPTPYKMIRTTNVKRGFIDTQTVRYVTKTTFENWTRRSRPQYGDVILTREAPVGEVGRCTFDESENIFLGQRLFQYRPDPELLDWNYLAYVLQSPLVQNKIHGQSFGATIPHIKVGTAENLEIPLPPLAVQLEIGAALAAYDDLIETNRRRIALLEESARLLYREWFVKLRFPDNRAVSSLKCNA